MIAIVPTRAALGFAASIFVSSLAIEARAQDASPWQRDGHSAVRLLAGSRSGSVLLGGIGTLVVVALVAARWPALRRLGPLASLRAIDPDPGPEARAAVAGD